MYQGHRLLWEAPAVEHISSLLFQIVKAALRGEEDWFIMGSMVMHSCHEHQRVLEE